MHKPPPALEPCQICSVLYTKSAMIAGGAVRSAVADLMSRDCPAFDPQRMVCPSCNARYRTQYVRSLLELERGELSSLDEQVLAALRDQETIASNINDAFREKLTVGQRVADRVASFGGSWTFICIFGAVILVWILTNAWPLLTRSFDPYPYILLNLVLSTVAALQAPVIMMSQNRQASKDRLQAEHDYRVNLKAELEIRMLHTKLDQLLTHQWQRLIQIQEVQMDLMEELNRGNRDRN